MKSSIKMNPEVALASVVSIITMMLLCIPFSGLVTMLCWNYLAPLFHVPQIGWCQAMVLQLLCAMLFKSSSVSTK